MGVLWVVHRKESSLGVRGGIVAFKLTLRCFEGVLGDQGCESTTFSLPGKNECIMGKYFLSHETGSNIIVMNFELSSCS